MSNKRAATRKRKPISLHACGYQQDMKEEQQQARILELVGDGISMGDIGKLKDEGFLTIESVVDASTSRLIFLCTY